jgi:hypothetical protein
MEFEDIEDFVDDCLKSHPGMSPKGRGLSWETWP